VNFKTVSSAFALGLGGAILGMTFAAVAPQRAEAGPNCGQYDTKQERQICRGLRDGIRREIREDRYGRRYGRYGRYDRYDRYDRHDTRRRVEDGLADGLADLIRGR